MKQNKAASGIISVYDQWVNQSNQEAALNTQCTLGSLQFHPLGRRCVTGRFDGGRISSDAGGMLLREVDQRIGLTARMEECFADYRNLNSVEHQVVELLIQCIYAIALGYEDLNDHDALRDDPVLPVLVGKQDLLGKARVRQRDRNHALASASTLNRFELGEPQEAPQSRYKRSGPANSDRSISG